MHGRKSLSLLRVQLVILFISLGGSFIDNRRCYRVTGHAGRFHYDKKHAAIAVTRQTNVEDLTIPINL